MRKGYTILGVLLVLVIVSIIAVGALPEFKRIMRRAEMGEVRGMLDSVRAGARQYVFKQGTIGTLSLSSDPPPADVWDQLNVDVDPNAVCTYTIIAGGTTDRQLKVESQVDGVDTMLYTYDLPNGPGALNSEANNPDARYLQDLP